MNNTTTRLPFGEVKINFPNLAEQLIREAKRARSERLRRTIEREKKHVRNSS